MTRGPVVCGGRDIYLGAKVNRRHRGGRIGGGRAGVYVRAGGAGALRNRGIIGDDSVSERPTRRSSS
jgi:hypothetical protein